MFEIIFKIGQNREHHRSRRWSDGSEPHRRAGMTQAAFHGPFEDAQEKEHAATYYIAENKELLEEIISSENTTNNIQNNKVLDQGPQVNYGYDVTQ